MYFFQAQLVIITYQNSSNNLLAGRIPNLKLKAMLSKTTDGIAAVKKLKKNFQFYVVFVKEEILTKK